MSISVHPSRWSRRDVLKLGVASATVIALNAGGAETQDTNIPAGAMSKTRFRTPLCDLFGIEYPIFQAPMFGIVTPAMVAAVGRAGGLGIIPGITLPPDELRRQIQEVRKLTDRPFGVNLLLHPDIHYPVDPARIPDEQVRLVQGALNRFRERLGLPTTLERPAKIPNLVDAAFEVIVEERVPVFSIGLGNPSPSMVERCHKRGIKVIAMVATVADALEVVKSGVDAIVAQGAEAGGHRSTWVKRPSPEFATIGTMALVPQIVDAVKVPVIAAGGLMEGRGLMAALMLGATGVLMGTRFIATAESAAPIFHKQALIERDSDSTTLTDAFTGLYARVLRNTFTEEYAASKSPVFPPIVQQVAARDITAAANSRGDGQYYPLYAGQGVGMINDLPSAGDMVHAIIREARDLMANLPKKIQIS